jgi:uncharacterized membrane protein YhaH (DUF805 family)
MMFKAYIDFWRRGLQFKGLTTRAGYWWYTLAALVINALFVIIMVVSLPTSSYEVGLLLKAFLPLAALYSLLGVIPSIALNIRRLRDTGLSQGFLVFFFGSWIFSGIALLIPTVLMVRRFILTDGLTTDSFNFSNFDFVLTLIAMAFFASALAYSVVWLVLMCRKSAKTV